MKLESRRVVNLISGKIGFKPNYSEEIRRNTSYSSKY